MATQPTQPAGEGMADAEALAHLDKVCGLPSLVTNLHGEKFTSIRSRHVRVHVESLIAERDALRQEVGRLKSDLADTSHRAASWHSQADANSADRDRLAARCEVLEKLLREARMYVQNDCEWTLLSEIDAALSPPASDATEPPVRTWTVADYPDSELLRRAVTTLAKRRRPQLAWNRVSEIFGLGSTYSAQLCRRFGLDPHTGKTLAAKTEPLAAGVA